MEKINITITEDLKYYLNDKEVTTEQLESDLAALLQGNQDGEGVVVMRVDKTVPVEHLARVAGIAANLNAKVTLATLPE